MNYVQIKYGYRIIPNKTLITKNSDDILNERESGLW